MNSAPTYTALMNLTTKLCGVYSLYSFYALCGLLVLMAQVAIPLQAYAQKHNTVRPQPNRSDTKRSDTTRSDAELRALAERLAHQFIIVDGHVDLPYRLRVKNFKFVREFIGLPVSAPDGDFDYVRAKQGGLTAPFMSIYTPSSYQKTGGAKRYADSLITLVQGIVKAHPDKFALANSPREIRHNFAKGKISLPLGMENGAPIEDSLHNVAYFHKRGVRYVTLTHATDNLICDASYDSSSTWGGLSPYGRKVVEEMNRVGIMVDVSHVSDSAFFQVMRLSKAPCIASHSSCRHFTPTFKRNMSDEMICLLAQQGGVIHINFSTLFLSDSLRFAIERHGEELAKLLKERGLKSSDSAAKPLVEQFQRDHAVLFADVETVADHIDHVRKIAGIDHVAFGSDFDGVGDSLPTGLKDVSQYPNLLYVLLKRGYTKSDLEKICFKNTFRVWQAVERVATQMQRSKR